MAGAADLPTHDVRPAAAVARSPKAHERMAIRLRERLPEDCPNSDERAKAMIAILVRMAIGQLIEEDRKIAASAEREP